MSQWGSLITTELNSVKTILLSIFVAIGAVRIIIEGIKYKGGTDDERLEAKKAIRSSVIWFLAVPFSLWLATYLYGKATRIAGEEIPTVQQVAVYEENHSMSQSFDFVDKDVVIENEVS